MMKIIQIIFHCLTIAEKFFVTPSYLSRSFKKAEGVNLISYITEKRIQKAKKYIENGELKLSGNRFSGGV